LGNPLSPDLTYSQAGGLTKRGKRQGDGYLETRQTEGQHEQRQGRSQIYIGMSKDVMTDIKTMYVEHFKEKIGTKNNNMRKIRKGTMTETNIKTIT
jgi:hypothetical protein